MSKDGMFLLAGGFAVAGLTILYHATKQSIMNDKSVVRRAGLDIGSGSMKLVIAEVNSRSNKIVSVITTEYVELLLAHNLHANGGSTLSEAILLEGFAVMRHLVRLCMSHDVKPTNIRGVATEV